MSFRNEIRPRRGLIDLEPSDSCGVGFVASTSNHPSHEILQLGLTSLANVGHRGAVGADGKTGDGAGVTTSIPSKLVKRWLCELNESKFNAGMTTVGWSDPEDLEEGLQDANLIGIGVIFFPADDELRSAAERHVREQVKMIGVRVIGFRDVPTNPDCLGEDALASMPRIVQVFIDCVHDDPDRFERELFLVRRGLELAPKEEGLGTLYVASMSCRTLSYKGMVLSSKLGDLFTDLADPEYECSVCIFHQRFSTNTAPQWSLCQPFRMLAHNGEINTVRGNRNWMSTREKSFDHPFWRKHRSHVQRLFSFNDSDSASLDNAAEILTLSGRSLLHSLAMLIPPAWENDPRISADQKAFFEFHGCFSEPWDGPAAVAITNGKMVAACLDRNGLRPLRYKLTRDEILLVGSEVGADRVDESRVIEKGRLAPGEMIAVDLDLKRVLKNPTIRTELAGLSPYQEWLDKTSYQFVPPQVASTREFATAAKPGFRRRQIAAGLTREEIEIGITKMASDGVEPTFSMGVDTPLAALSRQSRPLTDYFKQRFAQVTNPPIDPIREQLVMSLSAGLGPERNILAESPEHCRVLNLSSPILMPGDLEQLEVQSPFTIHKIDCTWPREEGVAGIRSAVRRIVQSAQLAIEQDATILVLSDRSVSAERVAMPMLMATGAIHHGLCQSGHRMMCSIVCETADVRDPHQLSVLFGYGATVVYPYLAYGTIARLHANEKVGGKLNGLFENYRVALSKGLLKIISKMGISILNSYQGAQIFEAIGIGPEVISTCFKHSYSNIGGVGFDDIAEDCLVLHDVAYRSADEELEIADPGITKPKRAGEHHVISGRVTKPFHQFVKLNQQKYFEQFSDEVSPRRPVAIRDLLQFTPLQSGKVPLDEVEPAENILRRFTTAAMSLGAISPEAHEAIAIAMNAIGGKSNSGEGGEDPSRFEPRADGASANSKIKQIASGRFGVDAEYLASADEIEIKMAQGAKPGEGGQLPGFKVNELIARLRNTEPGVTLISPPPHHDIYSIEDLAQLIFDLKAVNPLARVCVKLVAKTGVGGIAIGVAKAKADSILISGHEGGTGASPLTSIKHAGIPWELGLSETHQSLVASSLRNRIVLRTDGGMRTGRDVIHAAILGAEEYNFGTMALIALGCVYVKKCHLNNCPVGIATQDPKYRAKFKGKPENLINYLHAIAGECRELLAELGVRSIDDIIGRTELLTEIHDFDNPKTMKLDLSAVLYKPDIDFSHRCTSSKYKAPVEVTECFDDQVVDLFCSGQKSSFEFEVFNTDRNIGTRLAGIVAGRFGKSGLDQQEVELLLNGTAGQSLGAFLCNGIRIRLTGEANDYVGKGMCGGEIVILPQESAEFNSRENVIAGNTILYGATGGKFFASGQVAERFCVRNSGAIAVVEGCGDHGCEYMTRGTAVVLGPVGNNFAAAMTGGEAFVWDPGDQLESLINGQTVTTSSLSKTDSEKLRELIDEFQTKTGSPHAGELLADWKHSSRSFRKVKPITREIRPPKALASNRSSKVAPN